MNGVHDMGGMQCYGPIAPDPDEPLFHEPWERQVLALTLAMGATGTWNLDASRFSRESLPPDVYLSVGYYRIWLYALENILVSYELASREEIAHGKLVIPGKKLSRKLIASEVPQVLAAGSPVTRPEEGEAKFAVGDTVVVRNQHTSSHTRLPGYIRGRCGTILKVHGCHVFPDSHARGAGEDPRWLYSVSFTSAELWGRANPQLNSVNVDCWEPYLESS